MNKIFLAFILGMISTAAFAGALDKDGNQIWPHPLANNNVAQTAANDIATPNLENEVCTAVKNLGLMKDFECIAESNNDRINVIFSIGTNTNPIHRSISADAAKLCKEFHGTVGSGIQVKETCLRALVLKPEITTEMIGDIAQKNSGHTFNAAGAYQDLISLYSEKKEAK